MSELDELERDLLAAADTWFSQALHLKLQRLIQIARDGERVSTDLKRVNEAIALYNSKDREPLGV